MQIREIITLAGECRSRVIYACKSIHREKFRERLEIEYVKRSEVCMQRLIALTVRSQAIVAPADQLSVSCRARDAGVTLVLSGGAGALGLACRLLMHWM